MTLLPSALLQWSSSDHKEMGCLCSALPLPGPRTPSVPGDGRLVFRSRPGSLARAQCRRDGWMKEGGREEKRERKDGWKGTRKEEGRKERKEGKRKEKEGREERVFSGSQLPSLNWEDHVSHIPRLLREASGNPPLGRTPLEIKLPLCPLLASHWSGARPQAGIPRGARQVELLFPGPFSSNR